MRTYLGSVFPLFHEKARDSYGSSFPALNSRLHSTRLPTPPDLRVESEDAGVPGGEGGGGGGARAARALLGLAPAPRPSQEALYCLYNQQ